MRPDALRRIEIAKVRRISSASAGIVAATDDRLMPRVVADRRGGPCLVLMRRCQAPISGPARSAIRSRTAWRRALAGGCATRISTSSRRRALPGRRWAKVREVAIAAASHKLSDFIAIIDRNGHQLDGKVAEMIAIRPLYQKLRAFGWEVREAAGHDLLAIDLGTAADRGQPQPRRDTLPDRAHRKRPRHRLHESRTRHTILLITIRPNNRGMQWIPGSESWQYRDLNTRAPSLSVLADRLIKLAGESRPVCTGTADLQRSNGRVTCAEADLDRFEQFGIPEQNMSRPRPAWPPPT